MPTWKRLAREPLVHFLAIGAALFVFFAWRGGGAAPSRVVVTPGRIDHLVAGFTKTWQRPPNGDELKALVDEFVREEIATREAKAMGLDADDTIIRRRLRQKLEFVVEDAAAAAPVTDQELERYLAEHPEKFQLEPRVSLRQVYVSRDRRGETADVDARAILDSLRALGPDAAIDQVGDPLMVPQEIGLASRSDVARLFGESFAEAVLELEPGVWSWTGRVGLRTAPGAAARTGGGGDAGARGGAPTGRARAARLAAPRAARRALREAAREVHGGDRERGGGRAQRDG